MQSQPLLTDSISVSSEPGFSTGDGHSGNTWRVHSIFITQLRTIWQFMKSSQCFHNTFQGQSGNTVMRSSQYFCNTIKDNLATHEEFTIFVTQFWTAYLGYIVLISVIRDRNLQKVTQESLDTPLCTHPDSPDWLCWSCIVQCHCGYSNLSWL